MLSELNDMTFEEEQDSGKQLYKMIYPRHNEDSLINQIVEDNKVDHSFSTYTLAETSYS